MKLMYNLLVTLRTKHVALYRTCCAFVIMTLKLMVYSWPESSGLDKATIGDREEAGRQTTSKKRRVLDAFH